MRFSSHFFDSQLIPKSKNKKFFTKMEKNSHPRVWLITGANSGFGSCFVDYLLKNGEKVAAAVRRLDSLDALSEHSRLLKVRLDLQVPSSIGSAVQLVLKQWGRIDVLVNNAGYGLAGALEELTVQQIRDQMETNFMGLVLLTQAVIPAMRQQACGYIVNVASIAGLRGFRGMSLYCASKFAVVGLSEALAQELSPFGIRVSIVEPGPYRTDWAGRSLVRSDSMETDNELSCYVSLNKSIKQMMDQANGNQPGDPIQVVEVVWRASQETNPPLHMVFGDEAISYWKEKLERYRRLPFMGLYPHGQINPTTLDRS
jgi:NAD(P)-dependent dehydrogenase (short-subunit alcohol dehydrogenase family)